jgi:hypothetical protein
LIDRQPQIDLINISWSYRLPMLPWQAARPAFYFPGGMLALPACDLDLSEDHAVQQRDVARVISQPRLLAFARKDACNNHQFYHLFPLLLHARPHAPL